MREGLGVGESGLHRVVREAFDLLELNAFFTADEAKPAAAWQLPRVLPAWPAARDVHQGNPRVCERAGCVAPAGTLARASQSHGSDRSTLGQYRSHRERASGARRGVPHDGRRPFGNSRPTRRQRVLFQRCGDPAGRAAGASGVTGGSGADAIAHPARGRR